MLVRRFIGNFNYEVETSKACSVFFDDNLYAEMEQADEVSIDALIDVLSNIAERPLPISLTWQLTKKCNFSCPFCYIRDNTFTDEVSKEKAFEVIDHLVAMGLVRATLTGGECLLHPNFSDIYRHLKESGVLVTIFTNGSLIEGDIFELIKELPPFSVEITFYTTDFTSRPYQAALELRKLGIDVICKFTVSKDNRYMLESIEAWCASNGFQFMFDPMLFDGENGIDAKSQAVDEMDMVKLNARRFGSSFLTEESQNCPINAMQCKAADRSVFISPEFELSICPDLPKRWTMKEQSFEHAYVSMLQWVNEVRDIPVQGCAGCQDQSLCMMCAGKAIMTEGANGPIFIVPKGQCERITQLGKGMRQVLSKSSR